MKAFSHTVLRNSAFGMAAQLAIKVLSFIFSVIVVRTLGAEAFGQYSAVIAFVLTFAMISDLGLQPYGVRQVARWRDEPGGQERIRALYANLMALRLLLSLVTVGLLIATAILTHRPTLLVIGIGLHGMGLFLYGVQGANDAALGGMERLDVSATGKVLQQLVYVVLGGLALYFGFGYHGLIIANLLGLALMTFYCWRVVRRLGIRPGRMHIHTWPRLLWAGLPFGVVGLALGLSYRLDTVLLNIFRGDTETGYYNAAYSLVFALALFSRAFNDAIYPSLTREATRSPDRLTSIYERALRYLMMATLPIAVGGWALSDGLVHFLFEDAYRPAAPAMRILMWVVPLMFASEFLASVVYVRNSEKAAARVVTISSIINIVANSLLVPRFGFLAAAVMTVVTEAVLVGQYVWLLRSPLRRISTINALIRPALAALCMGGVLLVLRSSLPFLASIGLGVLVYLVALVVFGVVGRDELQFVRSLRSPSDAASEATSQ